MANARAKLYYTKEQYLDSLPVKNGNIIFVADSTKVCLDMGETRFSYNAINVLETEEQREQLVNPVKGFYFVEEDMMIWRWADERWYRLTSQSDDFVIYGDSIEDFPEEGVSEKLYFTDNGIYNWRQALNKYNLIANANRWDGIGKE